MEESGKSGLWTDTCTERVDVTLLWDAVPVKDKYNHPLHSSLTTHTNKYHLFIDKFIFKGQHCIVGNKKTYSRCIM